jgi:hypothetical protein
MNSKLFNPQFFVIGLMILAAAFSRLIPHPPNFTAVAAMALFGGAYLSSRTAAFALPIAAMFLSDLIIGFHPGMYAVYISFILIVAMGMSLRNNKKIGNIFLASVSASVTFFIITNFALWLTGTLYPKTGAGLAACFTAAVPFFHYTFLGDIFFVGVMFGSFELFRMKFPKLSRIKA